LNNNKAWVAMVGSIVALLLTIIIGVMIYWQISSSIPLTNDEANASRNSTNAMANTVFGLLPIVALVAVAGVILGVVLGFGGVAPRP
jgi:peptidoglycan biosynthesis protein MviN/MurJ (putative lipid II flippase)